jgi:hypothetical protein
VRGNNEISWVDFDKLLLLKFEILLSNDDENTDFELPKNEITFLDLLFREYDLRNSSLQEFICSFEVSFRIDIKNNVRETSLKSLEKK